MKSRTVIHHTDEHFLGGMHVNRNKTNLTWYRWIPVAKPASCRLYMSLKSGFVKGQ
jgi:hypothetical protein